MKCEVCGTENENGTSFCRNCGHELIKKTYVYQDNTNKKVKNDDYTEAAIAIGIIAIILALLALPIIPTIGAIIGIVLGCKGNKDNNNRTVAIILNIVALVIKVIQTIIWILVVLGIIAFASLFNYEYDDYDPYEPIEKDTSIIEGTYYCTLDDYETYEKIVVIDEEIITIKDYEDPLEPYITGEYASKFTMVLNEFTFEIDAVEENADEDEEPIEHKVSVTGKRDDKEIKVTIDHFDSYKCKKKFEGV